jgi:NADPH:quinone reductase
VLALVNTPNGEELAEIREVEEPEATPEEAIVEVHAFSVNRGELRLLESRPEGWRPGQDVTGVVLHRAADGSGPPEGARVVGLLDGGGWAQRVAAPTSRLAVLTGRVGFAEAATLVLHDLGTKHGQAGDAHPAERGNGTH